MTKQPFHNQNTPRFPQRDPDKVKAPVLVVLLLIVVGLVVLCSLQYGDWQYEERYEFEQSEQ